MQKLQEWEAAVTNPNTSPDILRDIARRLSLRNREERVLFEAIIAHANVPPTLLPGWIHHFPDAFLSNPVTPLLVLENPAFVSRLAVMDLLTLARRTDTPAIYMALALQDRGNPDVSAAVRWHIALCGEADATGLDWLPDIYTLLREVKQDDAERMYEAVELGLVSEDIARTIGWWPVLESTVPTPTHQDYSDKETISEPEGGWGAVIYGPQALREAAAARSTTPPKILRLLAREQNAPIWWELAGNPVTPPDLLILLYQSGYRSDTIGLRIAGNPAATPEVLALIARSREIELEKAVAVHPNTAPKTLLHLNLSAFVVVRRLARRHPAMPAAYRQEAYRNALDWNNVRSSDHLTNLSQFLIVCRTSYPSKWFQERRESLYWLDRMAVALHAQTPQKDIQYLAETDAHRLIRVAAKARVAKVFQSPFSPLTAEGLKSSSSHRQPQQRSRKPSKR